MNYFSNTIGKSFFGVYMGSPDYDKHSFVTLAGDVVTLFGYYMNAKPFTPVKVTITGVKETKAITARELKSMTSTDRAHAREVGYVLTADIEGPLTQGSTFRKDPEFQLCSALASEKKAEAAAREEAEKAAWAAANPNPEPFKPFGDDGKVSDDDWAMYDSFSNSRFDD